MNSGGPERVPKETANLAGSKFVALDTETARALQAGRPDANGETSEVPALFLSRGQLLIRGYGHNDRIVYGTGQAVLSAEIAAVARELLERPEVAYLHLPSAGSNCYQCRIDSGLG